MIGPNGRDRIPIECEQPGDMGALRAGEASGVTGGVPDRDRAAKVQVTSVVTRVT
jgi:hypothetical protein